MPRWTEMAEERISAVGCAEPATGRRIWSRVSAGWALLLWRSRMVVHWCGCFFFFLSFFRPFPSGLPRKLRPGKAYWSPDVYVDSGPLIDFSMGPKEWTAWETSWAENGMQMGPGS